MELFVTVTLFITSVIVRASASADLASVIFVDGQEIYFSTNKSNFADAKSRCEARDSSLISITSDSLNDAVDRDLRRRSPRSNIWTSGSDLDQEGTWTWGDGSRIDLSDKHWNNYTEWHDEPNGKTDQNCLAKGALVNWAWMDEPCDRKYNYICIRSVTSGQCSEDVCSFKGSCSVDNSRHTCQCDPGYSGSYCQRDLCSSGSCGYHRGACSITSSAPYYKCSCYAPYQGPRCGARRYTNNGQCKYHINDREKRSFSYASRTCSSLGGALAIPKNDVDYRFLVAQIASAYGSRTNVSFWIGGRRDGVDWKWLDGETIPENDSPHPRWGPTQPLQGSCMEFRNPLPPQGSRLSGNSFAFYRQGCGISDGYICEVPGENPCLSIECVNGQCQSSGCHWTCLCETGYIGQRCEHEKIKFISSVPRAGVIERRTEVEISCRFEGNPQPQVHWQVAHDSTAITIVTDSGSIFNITSSVSNSTGRFQVDSNLTVSLVENLGQSDISCFAKNEHHTTDTVDFSLNQNLKGFKDRLYLFSSDARNNYNYSEAYCKEFGGSLAKIPDQETHNFLDSARFGTQSAGRYRNAQYVGIRRRNIAGALVWMQDDQIVYNQTKHGRFNLNANNQSWIVDGKYVGWAAPYPVASNGDCVVLMKSSGGYWKNTVCSSSHGCICEKQVPGPTVSRAVGQANNTDVQVTWRPHSSAVGFKHRIILTANSGRPVTADHTPTSVNAVNAHFLDLQSCTVFHVSVTVCPEFCINQVHSTVEVRTGSVAASFRLPSANVIYNENTKHCRIAWTAPRLLLTSDLYGLQVEATSSLVVSLALSSRGSMLVETRNLSRHYKYQAYYNFNSSPNRKYRFKIRTRTCAGLGLSTAVAGYCTSAADAPDKLPAPEISGKSWVEGVQEINLKMANESNGIISCYFLIVEKGELDNVSTADGMRAVNLTMLDALSFTDANRSVKDAYIAVAMNRYDLPNESVKAITLGDESESSCDINRTNRQTTTASRIFRGKNILLQPGETYSVYLVTTTPTRNGVAFARSAALTVTAASTTHIIIIVSVVGVVFLVLCTILVWWVIRRRGRPRQKRNNTAEPSVIYDAPADLMETYENPTKDERDQAGEHNHYLQAIRRERVPEAGEAHTYEPISYSHYENLPRPPQA